MKIVVYKREKVVYNNGVRPCLERIGIERKAESGSFGGRAATLSPGCASKRHGGKPLCQVSFCNEMRLTSVKGYIFERNKRVGPRVIRLFAVLLDSGRFFWFSIFCMKVFAL